MRILERIIYVSAIVLLGTLAAIAGLGALELAGIVQ